MKPVEWLNPGGEMGRWGGCGGLMSPLTQQSAPLLPKCGGKQTGTSQRTPSLLAPVSFGGCAREREALTEGASRSAALKLIAAGASHYGA